MMEKGRRIARRATYSRTSSAVEALEQRRLLAGDPLSMDHPVIISEFVAVNDQSLTSRLRSSSAVPFEGSEQAWDWIELFNASSVSVSLAGMHLTDDPDEPTKWAFPAETQLAAGAFTVVFASGEDVLDAALDERGYLHTNFRLNDQGEYLALTDATGTVLHEFSPAFAAQHVDVSHAVSMSPRAFLDESSPVRTLVPRSDLLGNDWTTTTFDSTAMLLSPHGPVGFDRGDGVAEDGMTIGGELIDRSTSDFSRGSIVVMESSAFTAPGRVSEWSFHSTRTSAITPLLFRADGDEFVISGVGRTRTSNGTGVQSFPFDLQSGNDLVEPGQHFFGFKDGDNASDVAGVVEYDRNDAEMVRRYGGPLIGKMVVGQRLESGRDFGRTYSVQATTQARLAGPFPVNLSQPMAGASSLYARYEFPASELTTLRNLTLDARYEDGFIAYLNGVEVARRNYAGAPTYAGTATANRSLADANQFESLNISAFRDRLIEGTNVLAIHAFNDNVSDGEFLIDVRMSGIVIDSAGVNGFAPHPTPGTTNRSVYPGFASTPQASHPRGLYDGPLMLELTTPDRVNSRIYVTTDGSIPGPDNPAAILYVQPIPIDRTTTVRASNHRDGWLDSEIATFTYIFPHLVPDQPGMHPTVAQDPVWRPQLIEGLRAIPTLSLVTDNRIAEAPEVVTSIEWLVPDGQTGFQINAGVELFGGTAIAFPKQSMRISFKNQYGPSMLEHDVFDDPGGVNQFDQLLLRAGSHDTPFWTGASAAGSYIRNRWANDRQLEMGQPSPRGRFVHVYVNGEYLGQFQLMERPNAAFMANTYGGEKDDYDAINAGRVVDGDLDAWNQLLDSVDEGYASVAQYLDVVNYADYVLLQFFGGNNIDWRSDANWMAARRRATGAGFVFFAWDSDIMLRTPATTDITYFGGPGYLWTAEGGVKQYPEFRALLAERAQKWFFDDGMLTAENLRRQIDDLATEIRLSVIAETARWGSGSYTPDTWEAAIAWIKETYAPEDGPSRAETVIGQLRHAGLLPLADAPTFLQGGQIVMTEELQPQTNLEMTAREGIVYYTLDGSDPRDSEPLLTSVPLVDERSTAHVVVPADGSLGPTWTQLEFDDSLWTVGPNAIGYDTSDQLDAYIALDVEPAMSGIHPSAYVRIPFQVSEPELLETLELAVQYDDGFVAYLNGVEIARRNAAGTPAWNARATVAHANIEAVVFERFNIVDHRELLVDGDNILAVHGLNTEPTNVDFLLSTRLTGGQLVDIGAAPHAMRYEQPENIGTSAVVKARTYIAGQWSALREGAALPKLRVTEIMYHPPDPNVQEIAAGFDDADEFEFIELTNVSGQTIDLRTIRFVQTQIDGDTVGIAFDFQGSEMQELEPGEQVLVVENRDAFTARYGAGLPVAGQWQGGLSNSSETITLLATQTLLQSITYRDAWHPATDGEGASLEIRNVADNDLDAWNQAAAWTASTIAGGSPGRHPSHGVVGDSNGDGRFNSSDLVSVFIAGKYEDDIPGNATFSEGDWNGDGDFTTRDLVYAFQFGNYLPNAIPLHATPARLSAVRDVAFAEWHDGEPVWLRFRKPGMKLPPWTGESLADGDLP